MSKRLTGLNPLAYIGVEPVQPVNTFMRNFAPGPTDSRNVNIGDFWIDTATQTLWVLVSLAGGFATWISLPGGSADSFVTDAGTAIPAAGILNLNGDGVNINTTGAGNTVHVHMNTDPTLTGLTISGFTGGVLVSNGAGVISEVTTTNHSLLIGNSSGTISSLGVATNGQIPIGSTGADPVLSTITAGTGISVTNGAGSITIAATGAVAESFPTNSGTAVPVAGVLNVLGVSNIATSGSGNTVDISVSGTTNHSLQLGNSTGSLNSLGVATNGQLPIGSAGSDPVLATITAGTGVTVTNGAGSITIAASGSVPITFDGNTGSATPSGGVINIVGSGGISTTASGSTVTINSTNVPISLNFTLTSSQIKNLVTTPLQVIAAQGANKLIIIRDIDSQYNYGGSNAFTNVQTIQLYYQTNTPGFSAGGQVISTSILGGTNSVYQVNLVSGSSGSTAIAATNQVNHAIVVGVDSNLTNITGNAANDNSIVFVVNYEVVDVTTYF